KYGNRLIVMKDGQIIKDLTKEEKDQLDITDYYAMFE
ncbi:MAG: phosphonate ABC transporter ATP-binding protein, partial [Streptococcus thermophilus]|nr:phosphonate ABC transporter ATP-binding protein [Streptococcus thermophilus]